MTRIGADRSEAAIVIGGGPAGLFLAASLAARCDAAVALLERMPSPGRKLLASGGGQCNITQAGPVEGFLGRYGGAGRFLKKALYAFSGDDLAAWMAERGVALEAEERGKVFPASRSAAEVLRALLGECEARGVRLLTGTRVAAARREASAFALELRSEDGQVAELRAPFLAIATGGKSYPKTGSSGDGYALAESLGHSIVPPRPALAPVLLRDPSLCALAGLSFEDLSFAILRSGARIGRARGDILITHDGLSGPGILDASRGLQAGDILELDFSGMGAEAFRAELASRAAASPRSLARTVAAEAGLPKRLAELLCALAGVGPESRCAELRREEREAIARGATAFPAEIEALGGFDKAMATAGGVSLGEVDSATMGSRLCEGLYFAGEVLDYDGDTGGFNLQAAFSTAAAAARAMAAAIAAKERESKI